MRTENLTAVLAANLELVDARRTKWRYALGMTASALAALIPTTGVLHVNPELATPFIATWYLLGMLIPTAIGAWLGPRLLRW
jgi:hypothetical protein